MAARRSREAVAAQPGERVLDLAAGTGTSSEPFADAGVRRRRRPTSPWACCGSATVAAPTWPFAAADAMRLPFADDAFDAVTMSFGLRNVVDAERWPCASCCG